MVGFKRRPLWVWRAGDERRRPLYVHRDDCGFRLFDLVEGEARQIGVVRGGACDWSAWHRILTDLDHQGVRVRPRALMTTLFLRVCLSDLFVHGIGGAKYDEVTDWLIGDWLGPDAVPEFLTVSGTLRLPVGRRDVAATDERRLRSLIRDLSFNPERHDATGPAASRKRELIAEQNAASARFQDGRGRDERANRNRYREIAAVNDELRSQVQPQIEAARRERAEVARLLREDEALTSREYPWVSYPEPLLRDWLTSSAASIAAATKDPVSAVPR